MGPDGSAAERRAYDTFGWQGISLTIPVGWELVFTRGDRSSGYVRLADEERDRLEVRWERPRNPSSPARTVDTYVQKLEKRLRKDGIEVSVRRGIGLASPVGKEVECYRWDARQRGLAMLSICNECDRLVHVQVLGDRDESMNNLARTVFASLQDHPEDGADLWRFFDVEFRAPADLPLKSSSLKAGCIRMVFKDKRRRLEFVRMSLAEVVLAGKSLREWFEDFYSGRLKKYRSEIEEERLEGHEGLLVAGRGKLLSNPLGLVGRRRQLRAGCWHCEETNRLMICAFEGLERYEDVFSDALASFVCCTGD
ncbi:MAG: hypothetical protein R6X33_14385 [Candidatus Brocadiia bacterium]